MTEPTPYQKLAANLAHLRKKGASPERQKQEVARFKESQDAKTKAERALTGMEKVAATGSKVASGATSGLFDEAAGLIGGQDAKDTQRFLQEQLAESNPMLAFGAELVGSLAMPGTVFTAPAKVAANATRGAQALRTAKAAGAVVGEGAVQGGASAIGNAEGDLSERMDEGLSGAGFGAGTAGAIGGVTKAVRAARNAGARARGVDAPNVDEIAERMTDQDVADARQSLLTKQTRGLGDETMTADVLPQGEGALRAARTQNRGTASKVDTELRSRSTRLSNVADDRLSEHTGTQRQSGRKTLAEQDEIARTESRPEYEAAEAEWLAFNDLPAAKKKPVMKQLKAATAEPDVRRIIDDLKADDSLDYVDAADDDHFLLDRVYKELGERIRDLGETKARSGLSYGDGEIHRKLIRQRDVLGKAMTARSPAYKSALEKYAGPMANKRAYQQGLKDTPADMIPDELADLSPGEQRFYRDAKVQSQRATVPNADLGEFARFADVMQPISTRAKAEQFKAAHGEDAYREFLNDLTQMAKMQRMRAGGGESSTVDKLIEQMQAGGNPDLGQVAVQFMTGNFGGAGRGLIGKALDHTPLDRLLASKKGADKSADFLMQRGTDKVSGALDLIEKLRAEGKLPRPRDFRRPSGTAASARLAGGAAGRP